MTEQGPDDPFERAWLSEAKRQSIARAIETGEQLVWPDGSVTTVMDRLSDPTAHMRDVLVQAFMARSVVSIGDAQNRLRVLSRDEAGRMADVALAALRSASVHGHPYDVAGHLPGDHRLATESHSR